MSDLGALLPGKLLICIPFYYVENRLKYLSESLEDAPFLAQQVQLVLITNTAESSDIRKINSALPSNFTSIEIITPKYLGHPYFLTWSHFDIFRENLAADSPADYFMYREDDLKITSKNIEYWLEHSNNLDGTPFSPAFLRYEFNDESNEKMLTDVTKRMYLRRLPSISVNESYFYYSSEHNYQGWYLLNQEDTKIHLNGSSSNPDFGLWQIREKATQALSLIDVPNGFHSRNLIAVNSNYGNVDSRCLVQHLPSNYALDPGSPFAKLPFRELLISRFTLRNEVMFLSRKLRSYLGIMRRIFR